MGRRRTLTDEERMESRKRARSNFQIKLKEACNRVMEEIQDNPPHLICWLKGGVNLSRANELKSALEKER